MGGGGGGIAKGSVGIGGAGGGGAPPGAPTGSREGKEIVVGEVNGIISDAKHMYRTGMTHRWVLRTHWTAVLAYYRSVGAEEGVEPLAKDTGPSEYFSTSLRYCARRSTTKQM